MWKVMLWHSENGEIRQQVTKGGHKWEERTRLIAEQVQKSERHLIVQHSCISVINSRHKTA